MLPDYLIEDSGLVQLFDESDAIQLDAFFLYPEELKSVARVQVFRDFLVSNAQRCLNGFTAEGHNITLLSLTGPRVIIHNLCMQMGTPGSLTGGSGAAILLGGSDQGHDDITGNTIFWPYDGIQVGGAGGLVRAANISRNVIRSPARYGIAIGMGTTFGATAGITMIDNQIGCDSGATGTGLALFDGAVIVDGTNNGPNNCVVGTAIIPGNLQNINGQFTGVMGDSDVVNDLKIAPVETGGVLFGGTVNFLNFTAAWAASVTNATSVLINCPANTYCGEITFNGLTAHGGDGQTLPIVDITRGAGGPFNLSLVNSTICAFTLSAGVGEIAVKLNLGTSAANLSRFIVNNNRIGSGCFAGSTFPTAIGIGITGSGGALGDVTIIGNDISEPATPISYTPAGERITIVNNMGVDNVCPNLASGTTVSLLNAVTCVHLTGGTTITGINGAWVTRTVRVIADSGLSLNTGGTPAICAPNTTLSAGQQSILTWNNEGSCWLHTP